MNKALFLDRDGVINIDYGHVFKIKDFVFVENIFEFCKKHQDEGYLIIIITNQAGIAKGYYSLEDFYELNSWMTEEFKKRNILITHVYICPHHPNDNCDCRKPKPGMILQAQKEYEIDLEKSILVGDKMSDLQAGHVSGIKKLYFLKGMYMEEKVDFQYAIINL